MERVLTLHKTVPVTELPSHISSILWNVDDTIASKTKPSSQALHPIEEAYFHQSHLKGKQDYGHQAVAVMLSCNGIVLNYAFVLYNKSISKIDIVQNIAEKLPESPVMSYLWDIETSHFYVRMTKPFRYSRKWHSCLIQVHCPRSSEKMWMQMD